MQETASRIKIDEAQGRTVILIKPHNSLFHAFMIELIFSAVFMAFVLVFAILASVFKYGFIISALSYILAGASFVYKFAAVFEALRSVLWTIAGGEKIEISGGEFIYSKKTAGIGGSITIKTGEIKSLELVDYIREKDVIHMIQSEIGISGRSFEMKTAAKKLKFGVYISMDDSDMLEKIFKEVL